MNNLALELTRAANAVAALGGSSAEFAGLTDAQVLAARVPIAALLRLTNTAAALLAGTIAERSRPQLGQSGLAARHGFGTPALMVQHATGLSRIEAGRLVAVGVLMSETETAERSAAEAHEAARVAQAAADAAEAEARLAAEAAAAAAADAAAGAQRQAEWEAAQWEAREADRAAAWAELHPDLPLPAGPPRPLPPVVTGPIEPVIPIAPVAWVPAVPVVPPPVVVPWQAPIVHAVAAGIFSPGVGDALLRGLGTLDQAITAEKLAAALRVLLVEAPGLNTEQAYKRARRLRDELDAAGIFAREKQARDDTTWSVWRRADGMVTLHALLPPEQGELWMATYDALTSPRRGGVRFVDPARAAWAQSVKDDPRTVDQIAADSFTQLLKLGADADPNTLFGGRRPVVQVIVTEPSSRTTIPTPSTNPTTSRSATSTFAALNGTDSTDSVATTSTTGAEDTAGVSGATGVSTTAGAAGAAEVDATAEVDESAAVDGPAAVNGVGRVSGRTLIGARTENEMSMPTGASQRGPTTGNSPTGSSIGPFGYFEGNPAPVSAETIDRHLCDTGYLGILFSQDGQPLNVGRDERLFNRDQRRALAARDGGCRWPGCDRPPSWSEAHHVENWADLGESNIDQAILLCAHHHLLLHNGHWKILLLSGRYCLQPPTEIDPEHTLITLPSKNPLLQEHLLQESLLLESPRNSV